MKPINTVIEYGTAKLREIAEANMDKPIPNWFKIEDMQGFGIDINEGELNLKLAVVVYPVEEAGPGHFLIKLQASFMSAPAVRNGYTFSPAPVGSGIELDCPIYAESEEGLQNGILQFISEEAENILCQMLQ